MSVAAGIRTPILPHAGQTFTYLHIFKAAAVVHTAAALKICKSKQLKWWCLQQIKRPPVQEYVHTAKKSGTMK